MEKFQWAGCVLLKSVTMCRYLESVVSSGVQAHKEMKDLEERVTFIQNEKVALDKAKLDLTSKVERLKELVKTKD